MTMPGMEGEQAVEPKKFACMNCRTRKLKCDSVRPSCSTCSKNNANCDYVPPSKRRVNKRRNIKQLEDRLLSLEGKLMGLDQTTHVPETIELDSSINIETFDFNDFSDIYGAAKQQNGVPPQPESVNPQTSPSDPTGSPNVTSIDSPGADNIEPDSFFMQELHDIYFKRAHSAVPILHKVRYLNSFYSSPALQPPTYLRYMVWALAAHMSDDYKSRAPEFYRRARYYIQEDEMADSGNKIMSLDHVRFYIISGEYETRNMFWNRGWSSYGRAIRTSQLLEIQGLDDEEDTEKRSQKFLAINDWTDVEAIRRMFWYLFNMDRFSAVITGRPMTINEADELFILLPASENAFQSSQPQSSVTWEAVKDTSVTKITAHNSPMVIAGAFGDLARHLHRRDSKADQSDVANGAFWKRHWELDAKITRLQMILPELSRCDPDSQESDLLSIRLQLQGLTIGLYKAAGLKAETYHLDEAVSRQCSSRLNAAAEEMVQIMRQVSVITFRMWSCFHSFCLHMAIDALGKGLKDEARAIQSRYHLETLLATFRAMGGRDAFHLTLLAVTEATLGQRLLEHNWCPAEAMRGQRDCPPFVGSMRNRKHPTSLGGMLERQNQDELLKAEQSSFCVTDGPVLSAQQTETTYSTMQTQQMQDPFPGMMYSLPDMQTTENTFFNNTNSMTLDFELMGTGNDMSMNDQWYKPG